MNIAEIISPIEKRRIADLDRNATQASFVAKQERYQQKSARYQERMQTRKPGSKLPKRPEPPKPPQPPKPPTATKSPKKPSTP